MKKGAYVTRRYGETPKAGQTYTLRRGVYAILPREGRLLVTFQEEPEPELQLPGGGIDPGEPPLTALHREVFEETGWHITAPRRLGAFRRFTYMPEYELWAEKLCVVYVAVPVRRLGPPTEAGHEARWMSAADAQRALGNPGDRAFVERFAASL